MSWLRNTSSVTLAAFVFVAALSLALGGCTVIRYVGGDTGDDDNGNQPDAGQPPEPQVVDVLVQADLRKSAAAFGQDYQSLLQQLTAALKKQNVEIRQVGLAPMYRTSNGEVPLVYGRGNETSDFSSLGEAYQFYTRDDGSKYLTDSSKADGENLAALGMKLNEQSIYHPNRADPGSRAYFKKPEDGLVVISLTASKRRCSADSSMCQLNGKHPGTYFTEAKKGAATWVDLPGQRELPISKIFHLSVGSPEGNIGSLYDHCTSFPRFPQSRLDYMQKAGKQYFGPTARKIRQRGGEARYLDLCRALSESGQDAMKNVANEIAGML